MKTEKLLEKYVEKLVYGKYYQVADVMQVCDCGNNLASSIIQMGVETEKLTTRDTPHLTHKMR